MDGKGEGEKKKCLLRGCSLSLCLVGCGCRYLPPECFPPKDDVASGKKSGREEGARKEEGEKECVCERER